jgi:DNA-directed RNA polymerase subunit RPC12/RpoP
MAKTWYYLKSCPNCSTSIMVLPDAGVSPASPGPPLKVECSRCGSEVELTGRDLREQK